MNIARRLLPLLVLLALPLLLRAQDERPVLDARLVPATGATPEAFVPKGWKIEEPISGDLNNDKRPDVVLDLIEDIPAENAEGVPNTRMRALVVLFREPDNSLRRVGVGPWVLWCTTCGGMLGDPSGSGGLVRIEKGVLIVDQLSGSREATNQVERFRWDPKKGSIMKIGDDIINYDRLDGSSETVSTNFLTGMQVLERSRVDKRTNNPKVVLRKKIKGARQELTLELTGFEGGE